MTWSITDPTVRRVWHGLDGTKLLPEAMLTNLQWDLLVFTWVQFGSKCLRYWSLVRVCKLLIKDYSHISQGQMSWYYYIMDYRCVSIPPHNEVVGGILVSLRPSVRPSRVPCPLCSIYSSGWILSIFGTNDQYHERVCRMWWPLTLTYTFKVIWPWLRKSCPLFFLYLAQLITSIRECVACYFLPESWNLNFWQMF